MATDKDIIQEIRHLSLHKSDIEVHVELMIELELARNLRPALFFVYRVIYVDLPLRPPNPYKTLKQKGVFHI